jgi:hypothetical protein
VLPWSFGAFVLLTMLLDFSGSSQAREMADWMSAVRPWRHLPDLTLCAVWP